MTSSPTPHGSPALWGGRFDKAADPLFREINDSLEFDFRLVKQDIAGSFAWAKAIHRAGVLTADELKRLTSALDDLAALAEENPEAPLGSQTLGVYGVEQGFYLLLPILGPSSARDSVGMVGDFFLHPVTYISPWYASFGFRTYEEVNKASLRIGEYESLKEAAIDPYVALRDAYAQYRQKMVEAARGKPTPPKPGGVRLGEATR